MPDNRQLTTDNSAPFERFRGKRGLVMGLGVFGGGVDSAKFLARYCKHVIATDLRDEETLKDSVAALQGLPVEFRLGEHRQEDFRQAEVVIHSPAVRPDNKYLEIARQAGAEVTMEMSLFIEACPATTIGVTGSNGKTTTALLCYEILCEVMERAQPELAGKWADPPDGRHVKPVRKVWLGGNIGQPLLSRLEEISADDIVVLELSSFQLHDWHRVRRSCDIAVLTNITPNHLDWHEDFDEYVRAKCAIFDYQKPQGRLIINVGDPVCAQLADYEPDRAVGFTGLKEVLSGKVVRDIAALSDTFWFVSPNKFRMAPSGDDEEFPTWEDLRLPGRFNRENAVAAVAALGQMDGAVSEGDIRRAFRRFRGAEHRLEFCGEVAGARCFNDSIATTPESTMAALSAFDAGIHLILGGSDKGLDYTALARAIAEHGLIEVYLQGDNTKAIADALDDAGVDFGEYDSFDEACLDAFKNLEPGDVLLMSPASASFYAYSPGKRFTNFEHRGRYFKALVQAQTKSA